MLHFLTKIKCLIICIVLFISITSNSKAQSFQFSFYKPFSSDTSIAGEITSYKNHNIWVTRKGHFATNKSGDWIKTEVPNHDTTRFQRIIITNDSIMWIDSWNNGIVKFINEIEVAHYTPDNSMLPTKRIESIAYDEPTNTLWAATQQGLVSITDNGDMELFTSQNSDLPNDEIYDVVVDDSGVVWLIADGHLLSINQGTWTNHNLFFFDFNNIFSLVPAPDNTLWVFHGTQTSRTDGSVVLEKYKSSGATTTGAIDAEGRLWTDETIEGLRIIKDKAQFLYSKDLEEDDPIDLVIFKIHATSQGNIWIASTAGLFEVTGIPFSASIGLTEPVLCEGDSNATLSAVVLEGTAPFEYDWSPSNLSGEVNTGLPAGDYSVTITDGTGATRSSTLTLDAPVLNPRIIVRDSTSTYSNIVVLPSGSSPPFSFEWNDGETDGSRDSIPPGNYEVTVTDGNGCQKILTYSFGMVSTSNINNDLGMSVYPSISEGIFNIKFENDFDFQKSVIQVFDLNGRLLKRINPNNNISNVDLSALHSGIYWMVISMENQRINRKVIVNK